MLKVVKLVINIFLFFLFSKNAYSQTINDDYLLTNKVIELTRIKSDTPYKLLKYARSNNDVLDKYYQFRYFNKSIYRIVKGYNVKSDSLLYESEGNKKREQIWSLKYAIPDSLFTKKDIEYFLQQDKNELWVWDTDKLIENVDVSNDIGLSYGNIIYIPYYSLNVDYAIIIHESVKTFTSIYIFKKENYDWVNIGNIKNIWW